jgi:hypothetical protein
VGAHTVTAQTTCNSQAQQLEEASSELARANDNLAHCKRLGRRTRRTLRRTKCLLALAEYTVVSVGWGWVGRGGGVETLG